ncbi:MAG: hypothetical protein ACE5LB_14295 [Acidiferrobacterales bacterium]
MKSSQANHQTATPRSGWWKRAGAAGLAFFMIKGLIWLMAPLRIYLFS